MFEALLAAPLVGSWINMGLFFVELGQVYSFYTRRRQSHAGPYLQLMRALVAFMLVLDIIATGAHCAFVWVTCVTNWGDPTVFRADNSWMGVINIITTGLVGTILQCYLIWRYYLMSKQWHITLVLCLGALSGFIGTIVLLVFSRLYQTPETRERIVPASMLWIISMASTDLIIAAVLVIKLRTFRTSFQRTKRLLRRITYSSIQTGAITSFLALAEMIIYILYPRTMYMLGIGFFMGRAYSCTLLFNLNSKQMGEADETSEWSGELHSRHRTATGRLPTRLETMGSIHVDVHQSVYTQAEDDMKRREDSVGP